MIVQSDERIAGEDDFGMDVPGTEVGIGSVHFSLEKLR
jgi:hypothetical protein